MPQFDRSIQRSMALGEQSPNLAARADLDRWQASLALCQNCVTIPQGGATKRSGTQLVTQALAGSALYEFKYSRSDGYAIEAGENLFRFFRDFGVIESAPGVPYTLATPFLAAEVGALCPAQSADVMFIASGARPIQKLKRFGHTNWTIADGAFQNGPFMDLNPDISIRLYTTTATELTVGTAFTLKAFPEASAVWTADNVGGFMLLREQDGSAFTKWNAGNGSGIGDFLRYGDNSYRVDGAFGANSGPNPPLHTSGSEWDGSGQGRLMTYLHSGFGVVKITGYNNAHSVNVTVQSYVPKDYSCTETIVAGHVTAIAPVTANRNPGGSYVWAEGSWSPRRGYPRIVVLHQDRLIAYSTPAQPSTYWGSQTDDFENMLAGSKATDGFSRQVNVGDGVSEILWALSSSLGLVLGTTGPEVITRSLSNSGYLKPDDIQDIPASSEGSAAVRPKILDKPVFVTADGLQICKLTYDTSSTDQYAYQADDLTIFADHITQSGVLGLAWQRNPYRLLWAYRTDGTLIALTDQHQQQVMGWHRHPMQMGKVKSMAAVPSPSGIRQDLWLKVERALPAGTKTYIECLRPFFEKTAPDAVGKLYAIDGWFVDCGILYNGAPITQINAGLADFEGMSLAVFADGQSHGQRLVTGGVLTLDRAASKVLVGIPMDARVRTLVYDRAMDGGANSGRKQRTPEPTALVRNSAVFSASALWNGTKEPMKPTGGQKMNMPAELYSGVAKAGVPADWDQGGVVEIISDGPFPLTVQAISPGTQVAVN
jgi:hypothetical protein